MPEALDHGKHTLLINILTAVLGAMFFVAAIIVVMIFKKLKQEKLKKQLAIETARAVIVTHWTKKVTVEKPQMNGTQTTTEEGLVRIVILIIHVNAVSVANASKEKLVKGKTHEMLLFNSEKVLVSGNKRDAELLKIF